MWGQSLYILGCLLAEGFLAPGEIDPLNRRLSVCPKAAPVVQVAIIAETEDIKRMLLHHDIPSQTMEEVQPIRVQPARVLSHIYARLGRNQRLGLTGRPYRQIGVLGTSKFYLIRDTIFTFTPQFIDHQHFYLALDNHMIVEMFRTEMSYLAARWRRTGRPTVTFPVSQSMLTDDHKEVDPAVLSMLRKLQDGYYGGTRIQTGTLDEFLTTSSCAHLSFMDCEVDDLAQYLDSLLTTNKSKVTISSIKGGLNRFRATANRTREMVSLVHKARELNIHDIKMYLPTKLFRSPQPRLHLLDAQGKTAGDPEAPMLLPRDMNGQIDYQALVSILKKTRNLQDQADILYIFYKDKGLDWDTRLHGGHGWTVRRLLADLYAQAGRLCHWGLIRMISGMLRMKVEELDEACSDLLAHQKHLTVGLPPEPREKTISAPMPPDKLAQLIESASDNNLTIAVLTQEIMVFLAMVIRSQPALFSEMFRLRTGLIIQVMTTELSMSLHCSGEDATESLMNMSPSELKNLLCHILSGKEFGVQKSVRTPAGTSVQEVKDITIDGRHSSQIRLSLSVHSLDIITNVETGRYRLPPIEGFQGSKAVPEVRDGRQGQWLRRRRLDGALNKVPVGFYQKVWSILQKCHGLSIEGSVLSSTTTREMTANEIKFAVAVDSVLNRVPQPEYRQLLVEAMLVLSFLLTVDLAMVSTVIHVDKVVQAASDMFYHEQKELGLTDSLLDKDPSTGLCRLLYDSAPSGRFGTMTYLSKSVATYVQDYLPGGACNIQ